jgi:transcription antitermination factor NusG
MVSAIHEHDDGRIASGDASDCWYAAYTCTHHEKRVAQQLSERHIENFLPLYRSVRRWKDRRKEVDLPLFPGYVFVHIAFEDRLRVLRLPGVVQIVSFNGKAAVLPAEEIETLRSGLKQHVYVEPYPYLRVGRKVRIVQGPLAGLEGILVRKKEGFRLVISVNAIMRSLAVEVDFLDVRPC